jgi:hypothetical protein
MKRRDSSSRPVAADRSYLAVIALALRDETHFSGWCLPEERHAEVSAGSLSSVGFISNHATASSLKRLTDLAVAKSLLAPFRDDPLTR